LPYISLMNAYKAIATRITNAEESFINYVQTVAPFATREEAIHVLKVYRQVKAIKIDAIGGQFIFTHGAYGDVDVIKRAIEQEFKTKL
jgi:hypothetical protein